MRGKNAFKFWSVIIATAILVVFALTGLNVGKDKSGNNIQLIKSATSIRTGIDITGGVSAMLEPAVGESDPATLKTDLATVKALIEHRLDRQNILDYFVSTDDVNGRVIVEIPWAQGDTSKNATKLIQDSVVTAKLYFQEVKISDQIPATSAPTYKPGTKTPAPTKKPAGTPAPNVYDLDGGQYVKVGAIILQGTDIANASSEWDAESGQHVLLKFKPTGQQAFSSATARLSKQTPKGLLGIFMDEDLISAPSVNDAITNSSAIITGKFTPEETADLADKIRTGNLPFKLNVVQINVINSQLGQQAYTVTIYALLIALLLIMLFMLIYYRLPGLFAGVALLTHTALQLLFISNTGITITLPGMAGIILSIGLAVDANVIIFERIKEELRSGKTLRASVDAGFKRGFTAVLDGNVTAIIAAAVLWYFGTGAIQSFAITTLIGISLSFVTAVTFSRWMLKATSDWDIATHPWLWGVSKKKKDVELGEGEVAK